MAKSKNFDALENQRENSDRRSTEDRRKETVPVAIERRAGTRRKVQRRRQIDPTTCERDYTADEIEFMHALDAYKRSSGRMFPTCSEILEVIRGLGYSRSQCVDEVNAAPIASAVSSCEPEVETI
jgi:hypothetical protein